MVFDILASPFRLSLDLTLRSPGFNVLAVGHLTNNLPFKGGAVIWSISSNIVMDTILSTWTHIRAHQWTLLEWNCRFVGQPCLAISWHGTELWPSLLPPRGRDLPARGRLDLGLWTDAKEGSLPAPSFRWPHVPLQISNQPSSWLWFTLWSRTQWWTHTSEEVLHSRSKGRHLQRAHFGLQEGEDHWNWSYWSTSFSTSAVWRTSSTHRWSAGNTCPEDDQSFESLLSHCGLSLSVRWSLWSSNLASSCQTFHRRWTTFQGRRLSHSLVHTQCACDQIISSSSTSNCHRSTSSHIW